MGGGGFPPDNSAEVARIEAQEAREAREAEQQRKEEERARFMENLQAAMGSARGSAEQYFSSRGLDPGSYTGAIESALAQRRGEVPSLDPAPGSYFSGVGESVYNQLTEADRAKFNRTIDTFAPAGFATRRIPNDLDDPIIAGLIEEAFADADDFSRNLLDRGVVTQTGYNAAIEDLEGQRPGAQARLNELGLGILEGGRQDLRGIATEARQGAQNYELGSQFDPFQFQSDIDAAFTDFLQGLSGTFRAQAPENIFDTAGLAGIAGAAQGAGNTAFDPAAIAGAFGEEDEEEEDRKQSGTIF